MKTFEIFVSASYITDGGSEHCNCFKDYVQADNAAAAKKSLTAALNAEGYDNIEMSEPIEVEA